MSLKKTYKFLHLLSITWNLSSGCEAEIARDIELGDSSHSF